jgi:REP element-mobilizing transposase RayT
MTRPLRLEFPGALYHVTSRGDRKGRIFLDDSDYLGWQTMLGLVCERFNFSLHSFCQMPNHYHLMVETPDANLKLGMRQLNGIFAQYFNRRHGLVGHVFQGRYKAILVQKESYLLELARYIALNPVRAGLVADPDAWRWSSHRLMQQAAPAWLCQDFLLAKFAGERDQAMDLYRRFVLAGIGGSNPLTQTCHQLVLGDELFVARHRAQTPTQGLASVARPQRRLAAKSLEEYAAHYPERHAAMVAAYLSTAFTMAQIAAHFRVSPRTVNRAINAAHKKDTDQATAQSVSDCRT